VDRWVLNLLASRKFGHTDFVERGDGTVTLGPALRRQVTVGVRSVLTNPTRQAATHVAHMFKGNKK
jgi:hypothetical protein